MVNKDQESIFSKVRRVYDAEGFFGVAKRGHQKLKPYISNATQQVVTQNKNIEPPPGYLKFEEPCGDILPDKTNIRKFYNKHKGEKCIIIGNGPSLNKIDFDKLKGQVTFGVNGIFYKTRETGVAPTYYVVEDSHVFNDNVKEINEFQVVGQKFFPTDYKSGVYNLENTSFFRMNRGFYIKSSLNYGVPRFSTDCAERLYCGQSVTIINLQLAFYMGFTEVYLIGMDFSYQIPNTAIVEGSNITSTEDDPNHFHPDYFGKGKKWHDPQLDRVLMNYKMAKLVYECAGRKIYNATVGGNLDIFERVDFNSVF